MFSKGAKKKRQQAKLLDAEEKLREACSESPVELEKIKPLVQQYPAAAKSPNERGDLPIHLACYHGASLEVVELLALTFPDGIRYQDHQGSLPLHWACFGSAPLLVIQNLLLQYPESISVETDNQQLALHYSCHGAARLEVVKVLTERWPAGLQHANQSGLLPLHIACSTPDSNLDVVKYLVQQYPDALSARTNDGQLPVDSASLGGAPQAVVDYLQGASTSNGSVTTTEAVVHPQKSANPMPAPPVQRAAPMPPPPPALSDSVTTEAQLLQACSESTVTVAQIQHLLQQDPQSIMARTQKGMRPLHICCWKGASVDVVEYLIDQWPESIKARTTRDWIPLHVACASDNADVQLQVIQCLTKHWPEAVRAKDNKERIPLHICCFSGAPLAVVQFLVNQWPDSVMAMNNYASLPLHLACGTKASLDVIQYLVTCKPESLRAVDSEGRTPLELVHHPLQHDGQPDEETVAWLEAVYDSMDRKENEMQQRLFEKDRTKLMQVIEGARDKPVSLSSKYIEAIMQKQPGPLGHGHFGVVFLGNDTVLKQQFAIKSINRALLLGGNKDDLERIKREFKKEQKGLLRFRHPNIALLYGYCLSDSQRKGEWLIYQLAEKGSLDCFWSNQLGRERLASFGRRVQIALETFIGMRFLHVGNKYINPGFHRDIKSANIVLKRDMTAQLIDCGMATFSLAEGDQTGMSTGVKGTRGYVCPKYCTGSIPYCASCDIFSFGIVLAELWSGQLQNRRDADGRVYNYFEQYINEGRSMDDDLDKAFGFGIGDKMPLVMNEYKNLALDCMAKSPKKRPSGEDVMDRLEVIWHSFENGLEDETESAGESEDDPEDDSREDDDNSSIPGKERKSNGVQVALSEEDLVYESGKSGDSSESADAGHRKDAGTSGNDQVDGNESPQSRMETAVDASTCILCRTYTANDGFEECLMCLALQQKRDVIAKTVSSELNADSSLVHDFDYSRGHQNVDTFISHIDMRLNNSIPRLFVIVPEALKHGWKHPKTWLRRKVATKYNLFFICGHTYQVVRPPIKLIVSSAWIEKIALSLAVSLTLLQASAKKMEELQGHSGSSSSFQTQQLNEMLVEVENIVKEQGDEGLQILERIRSGIRFSDKDIVMLNGETYELIAEKAREDRDWRNVMEPARKPNDPHIIWVSKIVVDMDPDSKYEIINV